MELHERVRVDVTAAIKTKADNTTDLRYILGEFSRLKGTKDGKSYIGDKLTDEQAIRVLEGVITGENKLLEILKDSTSTLKPLCESYLPKKATRQELLEFITTIDFSKLKNKMMAVGITKKHFGVAADGKLITEIVQNIEED
jgi:hypothetical protein